MGKNKPDENDKAEFEKAVGIRAGFVGTLILVIKGIIVVALLPFLVSLTNGVAQEILKQKWEIFRSLFFGMSVYILLYLFITPLEAVYNFGQNIVARLFNFFPPLRRLLYYGFPFYAVICFIFYFIVKTFCSVEYQIDFDVLLFALAFTLTMHVVLAAVTLKKESQNILKIDYFFSLFLLTIFVMILLSVMLSVMLASFSLASVFHKSADFTMKTYGFIWRQLFVIK